MSQGQLCTYSEREHTQSLQTSDCQSEAPASPAMLSPQGPYLWTQCPGFAEPTNFQAKAHIHTLNSNFFINIYFFANIMAWIWLG